MYSDTFIWSTSDGEERLVYTMRDTLRNEAELSNNMSCKMFDKWVPLCQPVYHSISMASGRMCRRQAPLNDYDGR